MGQAEWQWFEHLDGDLQSFYLFWQQLWAEESLNVKERDGKPSVRGVGQMGRLEEGKHEGEEDRGSFRVYP